MKKLMLIAAAMLFTSFAYGGGLQFGDNYYTDSAANAKANSSSHSSSRSSASSYSGAGAAAISGGNKQVLNLNAPQPLQKIKLQTTGFAIAPDIMPTAPCMGSTSAGVGFVGGAISGGTTWIDDDCSYRETARLFHGMGLIEDAIHVICASKFARSAPACSGKRAVRSSGGAAEGDNKRVKSSNVVARNGRGG